MTFDSQRAHQRKRILQIPKRSSQLVKLETIETGIYFANKSHILLSCKEAKSAHVEWHRRVKYTLEHDVKSIGRCRNVGIKSAFSFQSSAEQKCLRNNTSPHKLT